MSVTFSPAFREGRNINTLTNSLELPESQTQVPELNVNNGSAKALLELIDVDATELVGSLSIEQMYDLEHACRQHFRLSRYADRVSVIAQFTLIDPRVSFISYG